MATCNVYGYIVDGSEIPKVGVQIQFIPAALPAINSSTGVAIHPATITCFTSSTGYFTADLIVNTDFILIINSIGMKEKIRIPNEVTVPLFTLTSAYVSGDPTPTDSSETNW